MVQRGLHLLHKASGELLVKARCCAAVLVLGCNEGLEDFFLLASISISRLDAF